MKKNIAKIVALVLVVAMCAVVLAACVPSDYSKAEANLKENGYTPVVIDGKLAEAAGIAAAKIYDITLEGKCTQQITAAKDGGGAVTIFYFDNSKDAKAFKKAYKAQVKESEEELEKQYEAGNITEEKYNELKEDMKDYKYGASGKVFYYGTKDAVKAC